MVDCDYYLYNGPIERGHDYKFIKLVDEEKANDKCVLFIVTPGGNPDAAFKIARYLQHRYEHFTAAISGLCKSAGTLLALGANEIAFAPYGELGPLDVQLSKVDQIAQMESGLNISEAFFTLEERARTTYNLLISDIVGASGGVVSFQTASHAATEIISALYGPIFTRIDPEEVGSRSRAMRIGTDYGDRLNALSQNLKPDAIERLADSYSSHGFVIDFLEAEVLFNRTRLLNAMEAQFVEELGTLARHPGQKPVIQKLQESEEKGQERRDASEDPKGHQRSRAPANGGDPRAAG